MISKTLSSSPAVVVRGLCMLVALLAFAAGPAHAQKKKTARKPAPPVVRRSAPASTGRPAWIKELAPGMLRDYQDNPGIIDAPVQGVSPADDDNGGESPKEGPDGKPVKKKPARLPSKQTLHYPTLQNPQTLSA